MATRGGRLAPVGENFRFRRAAFMDTEKHVIPDSDLLPRMITYFAFKEGRFMNKNPDFKIFFSVNFNFVN